MSSAAEHTSAGLPGTTWGLSPPLVLSLVPLLAVAFFALASFRRRIYISIICFPRDIKLMYRFGMVSLMNRVLAWRDSSVVSIFQQNVARHPDKACFVFEDATWTFQDVERYSNRVARAFQREGFVQGDAVALMLPNRAEYPCLWLGLSKLGVATALINTNLRQQPLLHSLTAAKCRAVIASADLAPAVREVSPDTDLYVLMDGPGPAPAPTGGGKVEVGAGEEKAADAAGRSPPPGRPLEALMADVSDEYPQGAPRQGYRDHLLYIYTSGTTGLPKAALMLNSRFLLVAMAAKYMLPTRSNDVLYDPLPQYHTAGGVLGAGAALVNGLTVVIRSKFSASAYFPDCAKYNCTLGQYIGEMCRYVLAVKPRPDDTAHRVRLLIGNGMRQQIWQAFVNRFKVNQICELYGATEGNTNIVNVDNTVGAVGFLPRFLPQSFFPMGLIRVDHEGVPVRGRDGLCQRCSIGEAGMFVGSIDSKNALREFHGYLDKEESRKKIVTDVFKQGDQAFLSGDILLMDEYGYLYFKDRTGDTFRWKGENVSTAEVEAVISNVVNLKDATVYGVEIPGLEGRAGMAAVVDPEGSLDLQQLALGLVRQLPSYARPLFLRITPCLELTGTFKIKKTTLQNEGYDPDLVAPSDKLYFLRGDTFVPLTDEVHKQILAGEIRL